MEISNKVIEEVWNKHAEGYDSKHNILEDTKVWSEVLKSYIGENKNQKVLDIGTGTGFLASVAAETGYRCTGVDLAYQMIDIAKASAKEKALDIDFLICDWSELPFEDNSYDIIINRCVLWTLFTPEKTLNEWKRVLKPGGTLMCFCPISSMESNTQPNHYEDKLEELLPLKKAGSTQLCNVISSCGYKDVEALELKDIEFNEIFNGWYLIKGVKA